MTKPTAEQQSAEIDAAPGQCCRAGATAHPEPCPWHGSPIPPAANAHPTENGAPWRLSDEDRVAYSKTIPGHLWDPVGRMCECGTEVGVACDKETVEQHLDAAAARVIPPVVTDR